MGENIKVIFKTTSGVGINDPDKVHTIPLTNTMGDLKDYVARNKVLRLPNGELVKEEDASRTTLKFIHAGRIFADDAVQLENVVAANTNDVQTFYVFYRPQQQRFNDQINNQDDNVQNNNDNNAQNNNDNVRVIRINIDFGLIIRIALILYLLVRAFKKSFGVSAILILGYLLNKIGLLGWFFGIIFPGHHHQAEGGENVQNEGRNVQNEKGALAKLLHIQVLPFFLSINPKWDVNKYVQTLKDDGYIHEEEEGEEGEGDDENGENSGVNQEVNN